MRTLYRHTLITALLVAAVTACGGSQPPAEAAPAPSASPAAPEAPPASSAEAMPAPAESAAAPAPAAEPKKPAWDDMSVDQKKEIMKTQVIPTMKGIFQEFDAKRFAEVKCTTCHGKSAKDGTFKMPNPDLPKLDFTNHLEKHMKKDPKIVKFMMERVVPEMAKIIGEPPFDPATNKGFSCGECHTMAK